MDAVINKLPTGYTKSPTVVLEAAFFLLQEGLLNIPDLDCINVKQARAFLWNAAWLQEHMNSIWEDGVPCPTSVPQTSVRESFMNFHLAIVGPGGTGKTAVLKLAEALTNFFAVPEWEYQIDQTGEPSGDPTATVCVVFLFWPDGPPTTASASVDTIRIAAFREKPWKACPFGLRNAGFGSIA